MNLNYILLFSSFLLFSCNKNDFYTIYNTDKSIAVQVWNDDENIFYKVDYKTTTVIDTSQLGVLSNGVHFNKMKFIGKIDEGTYKDSYKMQHGKQSMITYEAMKYVFVYDNKLGNKLNVEFKLSKNGVALRYILEKTNEEEIEIIGEKTSYNFSKGATAWLQPMSKAKSGWKETNPSYEEPYMTEVPVNTKFPTGEGWVYPALFKSNDTWLLISETNLHEKYCGSRLMYDEQSKSMIVTYPQKEEVWPGKELYPILKNRLITPWRIIAIGDLNDIFTSTLGTDLANPAISIDTSYIKGGPAAWSWIMKKDESINYKETINYIDYASNMKWPYCLIDVNWDVNIGYEKMKELVDYAAKKNVGLILWYNSSGDWNSTVYTPKSKLLTHEMRVAEFNKLQTMGIKGMKIDFFGGDGVSMIKYYHDILKDAAEYKLLVNFHGATLPRGWQRTYPNLMTMESIKGQEFITFFQEVADMQAVHCATIPFTRNVFDPMDFTPMILDSIPNIKRKTTKCFELALPYLFLSGIQHIAESPEGMSKQNADLKNLLKDIPVKWDESRLIDGYPGKYVIAARRIGRVWYMVGINATDKEIIIEDLDLKFTKAKNAFLITDDLSENEIQFDRINLENGEEISFTIIPKGGFVLKVH